MSHNYKWARGVSIIGGGISKHGTILTDPEIKGMTEKELHTWAVLEACEDAGIAIKDIDAAVVGQYNARTMKTLFANQTVFNAWLGAESKPGFTVVMACATGVAEVMLIGSMIASGLIDVGLISAMSIITSVPDEDPKKYRKHPAERVPAGYEVWDETIQWSQDAAYVTPITGAGGLIPTAGFQMLNYAKKYGLTWDELDDALNASVRDARRGAVLHPKSVCYGEDDFEAMAKKAGYDDALAYLRDPKNNPYIAWPVRQHSFCSLCDGAAAIILCASELADKFSKKQPMKVSGVGLASAFPIPPGADLRYQPNAEQSGLRQAYKMADLHPDEIEYLGIHDWNAAFHLTDSELAGYIPEGQAWKYIIDGETAFDGRKPMQTAGGELQFADSNDPAALVDIIEAVQQMRGECGARQVKQVPRCSVIIGRGINTFGALVLRNQDS